MWAPTRLAKSPDPRGLLFAILACYPIGYVGLMIAPHSLAIVWALFVGAGTTAFPLILTLVGLRARTPEGTAALSGVTQSVGYLIAAAGPFAIGALYDATGRLDLAARGADRDGAAPVRGRRVRRPTGRRGGPAQATSRSRSAVSCSSVIPPERR